jgi:hypothetical protein
MLNAYNAKKAKDRSKNSDSLQEANDSELKISEESSQVEAAKKPEFQFIYNSYTRNRGEPKMLELHCGNCDSYVMDYQKDGPGRLLRCYLDRIHEPPKLRDRQYEEFNLKKSKKSKKPEKRPENLDCDNCEVVLGAPMIYEAEDRPAYRLKKNAVYPKKR